MVNDATRARRADRKKVLISAYACEPGGSEPGAGWWWSVAAAKEHDVWVMTRANNRPVIEANSLSLSPRLHFVYLDLPRWLGFWKKHGRRIRLYYIAWQFIAMREGRRLHAREQFDLVHHLTFANIWLPALACAVDAPFLLGPVAGGQRVAFQHYRFLGVLGVAKEVSLLLLRRLSRLNPLVRVAWRRASSILVNNLDTQTALPRPVRSKTFLRPHPSVEGLHPSLPSTIDDYPKAAFTGRLHRFKGVELAIRALEFAPDWRLVIIGGGPELNRLRSIARQIQIDSRVEFLGWIPQHRVWRELAACDAFVFPSLKEGDGFAPLEAAALGLPVVAFDQGGPAALARFYDKARFELVKPADSAKGIAQALNRLGKRTAYSPPIEAGVDAIAADLSRIYSRVIAESTQGNGE
jgi:glycosyltransferase involved in cell wall biosynthesis